MKISIRKFRSLIREVLLTEAPVSADAAKELLRKFPKGLKKVGINVDDIDSFQQLGETGTHGTAFKLPDGRVLKVTDDAKEAEAAASLIGKNLSNIVKFYAVWQFNDDNLYGVLQELLEPLSAEEGKELNSALVSTALPLWIKRANGSWDTVKQLTKQHILDSVKKKFKGNHNSPEAQAYAKSVNEAWNLLVTKYKIRDMFNTLTELGIDFHDYHAGNLMKRSDGTLVLIDLGMSKIKSPGKPQKFTESRKVCILRPPVV